VIQKVKNGQLFNGRINKNVFAVDLKFFFLLNAKTYVGEV